MSKTFPTLYKRTATGAVQEWSIRVVELTSGAGKIVIEQGLQNGKKQVYEDTIREGKNTGKANETSPFEQACSEAQSRWNKQKDRRHYGLAVAESEEKRGQAPMLAQKYQDHAKKVDWDNAYAQPKYDGHRCLAVCNDEGIVLWSRTGKPITTVSHIVQDLAKIMESGDTFDGELYIHGTALASLSSLIKREQPGSKGLGLRIYDMISAAGFIDRFNEIRARLGMSPPIALFLTDTVKVGNEATLMAFQHDCVEMGYEGAMLRHGTLGYEAGKRSQSLLKVKTGLDAEFEIVSVREGKGTHKGMAIFSCKTSAGHLFDVTAPGTHEDKKEAWKRRDEYPGKLLTVRFQCMTSTNKPVPFQPVARGHREDL